MRRVFLILVALMFTLFVSCGKHDKMEATVIKDCTGTYLRVAGKDYHVCNLEKVNSFPDGAKVKVSFKRIETCTGSASKSIVCLMLRENEGWIKVKTIKLN